MHEIQIVPIGGRVKSAGFSFTPFTSKDYLEIDSYLKEIRSNPLPDFLKCFFPSERNRIKHLLNNVGFFRPFIKTDQGMAGSFVPFYVNQNIEQSPLLPTIISLEAGIAISENYVSGLTQDSIRIVSFYCLQWIADKTKYFKTLQILYN
jgi:hypothetical protein